jgi:hypothetical protein
MKFNFKVLAKTVPAICMVCGLVLLLGSCKAGLGFGAGAFGVFLILAGIGLQVLYLFLKYR